MEHEMLTGVETMDNEHSVQLQLIDAIEKGLQAGKPKNELLPVFEHLADFTGVHFLSEELLMRLHSYPDYEQHCDQHGKLLDALKKMQNAYVDGKVKDAELLVHALKVWLARHLGGPDHDWAKYLKSLPSEFNQVLK